MRRLAPPRSDQGISGGERFKAPPNGAPFITLGPAFEHEVIRWVLGEAGRIEVVHPPELRRKIAAAGHRIAEVNGD